MSEKTNVAALEEEVRISAAGVTLEGHLGVPVDCRGVVLFAHGSGSGRQSSRNRFVAREFQNAGLATLLIDLLTKDEDAIDAQTAQFRFDIPLLAERLIGAVDWLWVDSRTRNLSIGLFGASTGGGAALMAAAARQGEIRAVVSRGGRPDLAGHALSQVHAATLLIVGSLDHTVIEMNRDAKARMSKALVHLEIVEGASHLFEEPGALAAVASLGRNWFLRHLAGEGVGG